MHNKLSKLLEAEEKANQLFAEISARGLIQSGLTEKELNARVYELAFELFGIKKYWHKRIVRAGKNTLLPYKHNPQHLTLQQDDILFLDFGPVFEDWEADFGRTFVIGKDAHKLKLQSDIELAWNDGQAYYLQNKASITGAGLYAFSQALAKKYGWEFGNTHCGIGPAHFLLTAQRGKLHLSVEHCKLVGLIAFATKKLQHLWGETHYAAQ
jgi:Xaa-Pro aminopeptidase